ncbi:hypothetical protein EDC04DRAFT_3111054 [Pisolithus marmoratus]|nr:hypothetical protein EDC04DRAFT_3111054 [Pisolithus marmoratus]
MCVASLSHSSFIAILCYDYLLTLRREVDFFWMKPRRSWMFVLFVANRYITILGRVPTMVGAFWPQSWGEDGTVLLMIIRVYALYMKSKRVLFFLVSVILAGIAVGCWAILSPLPATTRPFVALSSLGITRLITSTGIAIAWSGQMTFDAVVFVLTLWRTLRVPRLGNRTLLDVFIRDGECYI